MLKLEDREEMQMTTDRKTQTRVALLEQSTSHIESTLNRIESKLEKVDSKIDKVESKIYTNFKWFLGISLTGVISVASMGFAIYQYVKPH
jgi:hypothetical protein